MRIVYTFLDTPIGRLLLSANDEGLSQIGFPSGTGAVEPHDGWIRDDTALAEPTRQLQAYFAGELKQFRLPLAPKGTPFRRRVWDALLEIPYGSTWSYVELARRVGNPNASRAVGSANGANPLPIVIPCHRVIGANGRLVGYGGGLEIKQHLLRLEGSSLLNAL